MFIYNWLRARLNDLCDKMDAENARAEAEIAANGKAWRDQYRSEMIAKERHKFIREFCVAIMGAGAFTRFAACGDVTPGNASKVKAELERMFDPSWHDGDIALKIAEAAWDDYSSARYGNKAEEVTR